MSTVILACAVVSVLWLIFILAKISAGLSSIHLDLCHIHEDLVRFFAKETKPTKQREYWRDQNGFKHWRKKDA